MKRIISILLAVAMLFSLAACGTADTGSEAQKGATVFFQDI